MTFTPAKKYNNVAPNSVGVICNMGKVKYRADRGRWFVQWGNFKIYRYKGFLCRDGEIHGMTGKAMAEKLLSVIQADFENCQTLGIPFNIERYTEQRVDAIPYMREWLEDIKGTISPATYKDYKNSIDNHLVPWLKKNPYRLHELKYDILCKLMNAIKRDGKGKRNVIYCLHACLDYACKAEVIQTVPPFPEKKKYGIVKKKRRGLPSARQEAIIAAIPAMHQPIFWWLKYHYRRPSEACALYKEDYDKDLDCFIIRRGFSNRQYVDRTKTGAEHEIPCHQKFKPIMEKMTQAPGPYFFTNLSRDCKTKKKGYHYTVAGLEYIWDQACEKVGEKISLYPGTKHSSCHQFLNEQGGTLDELQTLTDHARRDSVTHYAEMEIEAKRRLMGKVLPLTAPKLPQEDSGSGK